MLRRTNVVSLNDKLRSLSFKRNEPLCLYYAKAKNLNDSLNEITQEKVNNNITFIAHFLNGLPRTYDNVVNQLLANEIDIEAANQIENLMKTLYQYEAMLNYKNKEKATVNYTEKYLLLIRYLFIIIFILYT